MDDETGTEPTPHAPDTSSQSMPPPSQAANDTGEGRPGPGHVDPDELMFSNLAKHWLDARDTIESFANKYFSPANRDEPVTTSEWLQDTLSFGARMSSLWLSGIGMMAEESGRLARRAKDEQTGRGASDTPGS